MSEKGDGVDELPLPKPDIRRLLFPSLQAFAAESLASLGLNWMSIITKERRISMALQEYVHKVTSIRYSSSAAELAVELEMWDYFSVTYRLGRERNSASRAFQKACEEGKESLALYLLDCVPEIDINCVDGLPLRWPPLWSAALNGCTRVVKQLVRRGAVIVLPKPNARVPCSVLHVAAGGVDSEMISILATSDTFRNVVNMRDMYGQTPLQIAVDAGSFHVAKELLDRAANPNVHNKTPLHVAAINHDVELYKLLLEKKADARQKDLYGNLPELDEL